MGIAGSVFWTVKVLLAVDVSVANELVTMGDARRAQAWWAGCVLMLGYMASSSSAHMSFQQKFAL
eukprot:4734670-Amphidinium_carterae.1